ncbi:MAG: hypothetical protein IJ794_05290 [Lachnospiraceae bacterium]|nr:hypothetical protein [Lachnospiraceae bacterium]
MDIAAFYEVQNRLYNAAIAGCGILAEDFRLKRAIEGLTPLAEKGKVFAALKAKCEALLLAGDDAASQLSDCIALADAVAVTLGRTDVVAVKDAADTEKNLLKEVSSAGEKGSSQAETQKDPWRDASPIQDIPYSRLTEIRARLDRAGESVYSIPRIYPEALSDARVLAKLISGLNGKGSSPYDSIVEMVLDIYGETLVPAIKASIDFSNEASKGRQVALIERSMGARENAWYLELAMEESTPLEVRLAAIGAMSHAPENEELLMELYHTQKGKIKNAAVESLVRLNAEGIQPYLEKICAKEKPTAAEEALIRLSSAPVCVHYALDRVQKYAENIVMDGTEFLLSNKTGEGVAEAYLALAEGIRRKKGLNLSLSNKANRAQQEEWELRMNLERMLVEALFDGIPGVEELIGQLYEKSPETFAGARVYAKLLDGTLVEEDFRRVSGRLGRFNMGRNPNLPEVYDFTEELARSIRTVPVVEQYKLCWDVAKGQTKILGGHYPEAILKVLTDKKALVNDSAGILCCHALVSLYQSSMPADERTTSWKTGTYDAGIWERELIKAYALPFLEMAIKRMPALYYGCNIYRILPDAQGREDWYWEWTKWNMNNRWKPEWNYDMNLEIPDERLRSEVDYAIDKLNSQKLMMNKENFNRMMDMLKRRRALL